MEIPVKKEHDVLGMKSESGNLDLLRSIAVSLVLGSHGLPLLGWPFPEGLGHLGVLLFFIHTSYVLMMSMERLGASGRSLAGRFYIRRMFRIYPLAITVILLVTTLRIPIYMGSTYAWLGARNLAMNILLMNNLWNVLVVSAPLWSLSYEVQMYLVLPLLYFLMRRRSMLSAIWLVIAGIVAAELEKRLLLPRPYHSVFEYAPWFCAGIGAYVARGIVIPSLPSWTYAASITALIAVQSLATSAFGSHGYWAVLIVGIAFALTLPRFREIQSRSIKRTSHAIAKYSYGVYLSHVPILWLVADRLGGWPLATRIALAVILLPLIPFLMYHAIEEPMIRLGSRLSDHMGDKDRAHTAAA